MEKLISFIIYNIFCEGVRKADKSYFSDLLHIFQHDVFYDVNRGEEAPPEQKELSFRNARVATEIKRAIGSP